MPDAATTEEVQQALEAHGVKVHSVVFDPQETQEFGGIVALVRLPPLPLSWTLTPEELEHPYLPELEKPLAAPAPAAEDKPAAAAAEAGAAGADVGAAGQQEGAAPAPAEGGADAAAAPAAAAPSNGVVVVPPKAPAKPIALPDGRKTGDVFQFAAYVAQRLMLRKLQIAEQQVVVDAPSLLVCVYFGNLGPEYDDTRLYEEMSGHGALERCFVMRGSSGASKGYGGLGTEGIGGGWVGFCWLGTLGVAESAVQWERQPAFCDWRSGEPHTTA